MNELFQMLTADDVAKMLNISPKTLANWRCMGEGPKFHKIGRSVRYYPDDIKCFIEHGRAA